MGTPHQGADLADSLSKLLKLTFISQTVVVEQLQAHCETIMDINRNFRDRSAYFELISYYESKGVLGIGVR